MYFIWNSSRPGLISDLTLPSLIWCEVLVFGGTRNESSVILMHGAVQFPQDHALHRLSCPHWTFTPPLTTQAWLSFGTLLSFLVSIRMSCVPIPCCLEECRFVV